MVTSRCGTMTVEQEMDGAELRPGEGILGGSWLVLAADYPPAAPRGLKRDSGQLASFPAAGFTDVVCFWLGTKGRDGWGGLQFASPSMMVLSLDKGCCCCCCCCCSFVSLLERVEAVRSLLEVNEVADVRPPMTPSWNTLQGHTVFGEGREARPGLYDAAVPSAEVVPNRRRALVKCA